MAAPKTSGKRPRSAKNAKPVRARKLDVTTRLKPLPEPGFHYFPSPESSDDSEIIAYQYLYCATAVDEWPGFRCWLEQTGKKSPKECDDIEANAVNVFREVRDAITLAINTDNPALMSQPVLLDRLTHAHAYMALHANPASLAAYRRMIYPQMDDLPESLRPEERDFTQALWEGKWKGAGDRMPAEVTGEETRRNWWLHEKDGLYNTGGRLDPVATADELKPVFPATEPMVPLSSMQLAFISTSLRAVGSRAGLTKPHVDFLVHMALDGANQKENPSAWRAIRDRKRKSLLPEVQKILDSIPRPKNYF